MSAQWCMCVRRACVCVVHVCASCMCVLACAYVFIYRALMVIETLGTVEVPRVLRVDIVAIVDIVTAQTDTHKTVTNILVATIM